MSSNCLTGHKWKYKKNYVENFIYYECEYCGKTTIPEQHIDNNGNTVLHCSHFFESYPVFWSSN